MKKVVYFFSFMIITTLIVSCAKENTEQEQFYQSISNQDQMDFFAYENILLGDGVPMGIKLAIRWKVTDPKLIISQFDSVAGFRNDVLRTRAKELMNATFNTFESVDSIFSPQRQMFISKIKDVIFDRLGEDGIEVKEVICEELYFPATYTAAMKQAGLQRQELERINQESVLALAKAESDKQKAEAASKVRIAEAQAADRLEKIKADTEESRRISQLAAAETQKQIAKKQAESEAERLKLLAKADIEKRKDLKKIDIEYQRDQINVEVEKKKKMDMAEFDVQMEMAKVFQNNPTYASYLINKELASKVKIAVLPSGSDPNVFGSLLNQTITDVQN